jgi:hypothetical protein
MSDSTTFADHRAGVGDSLQRGHQLLAVVQAFLQEVRATVGAALEQCEAVARLDILAEHDDADVGCVSRRRLAIVIPSSSPEGGMRMSTTTTWGRCSCTAAMSSSPSEQTATTSTLGSRSSSCPIASRHK